LASRRTFGAIVSHNYFEVLGVPLVRGRGFTEDESQGAGRSGRHRQSHDRAPSQVLEALASGFAHLGRAGLLHVPDPRHAAAQFAYLVAGAPLDRAVLVGTTPPRDQIIDYAWEGVHTFLARYGVAAAGRRTKRSGGVR
jgi:AefR-like transcriptional repressor, C-terminal domain